MSIILTSISLLYYVYCITLPHDRFYQLRSSPFSERSVSTSGGWSWRLVPRFLNAILPAPTSDSQPPARVFGKHKPNHAAPDHTLVCMSISKSIQGLTSSGVHFSRSPIEAVSVAEEEQIQYRKSIMSMNKSIQRTQMRRWIMYQWRKRWESIQQRHTWQQSTCKKFRVR